MSAGDGPIFGKRKDPTPVPPGPTPVVNFARIFTDPLRKIFSAGRGPSPENIDTDPVLHFVTLVGRNVTSDTQAADSIVNSNNRLRTTGGYLGSETVLDAPTSFTMEIGEWAYVASGNIAGNASAFIPLLATAIGQPLFEVHQILQTLSAVGVATRTMTLQVLAGMPAIPARGAADDDFAVTGPTITDAEEGSVFIPRAPGLVQLNDNGTITTSDISPLPIMGGDSLTITSVITAGLAADTHRIAAVMRRVA